MPTAVSWVRKPTGGGSASSPVAKIVESPKPMAVFENPGSVVGVWKSTKPMGEGDKIVEGWRDEGAIRGARICERKGVWKTGVKKRPRIARARGESRPPLPVMEGVET